MIMITRQPTQSVRVSVDVVDDLDDDDDDMVPALALRRDNTGVVRETSTEILSPDLVKMTEGGTVTLECVVTEHESPPPAFIWHILGAPLDFSLHRGGIFLQNDKKERSSSSKLTMTR